MVFVLVFGFLLGVVAVLALEGLGLYWVIERLRKKKVVEVGRDSELPVEQQVLGYPYEKQGVLWILDQDKLPKINSEPEIKETKEIKNKKEIVETSPIKKTAKIKGHSLILTGHDGAEIYIPLSDCSVLAVSSSDMSTRKWYKRYPIKIESKDTLIYNGKKTCYVYFETSSEKESWCKALRLASFSDKAKIAQYAELQESFDSYFVSLAREFPIFQKSSMNFAESTDKATKIDDEPSSRVRHFFKKVVKKASRHYVEPVSTRGEKKVGDKLSYPDSVSTSGSTRSTSSEKSSFQDVGPPISPHSVHSGGLPRYNFPLDEGTLCLNLLLARLFFDAKRSTEINNLITARLQKTLSNLRTPSFVGEITCTGLNVGNLPPYIHHMRIGSMDMNEMCSMEVDIEYNGGFLIEIETRLEVCEPEFQGIVGTSMDRTSEEEVTSGLLEDVESYSNQLKFKSSSIEDVKHDGDTNEGLRRSKSTSWTSTYKARWKTIVNSIAEHVSQVPISLAIKVASLRGTLCLRIKPPPSDQIWYGFMSMPEIDFSFNSSLGDHKISNNRIATIIANRLKVAIRDSIVLPNCESICIPWMSAEKDDWVTRNVAPYIWLLQENDLPRKVSTSSVVTMDSKSKNEPSSNSIVTMDLKSKNEPTNKFDNSKAKKSSSSNSFSLHLPLKVSTSSSVTMEPKSRDEPMSKSDDNNKEKKSSSSDSLDLNLPRDASTSSLVMMEPKSKNEPMSKSDNKVERSSSSDSLGLPEEKIDGNDHVQQSHKGSIESSTVSKIEPSSFSSDISYSRSTLEDLKTPLLGNQNGQVSSSKNLPEPLDNPSISNLSEAMLSVSPSQETPKEKKHGRREKMMNFGKRMGEKLEEKKRHIGEKGRHVVDKLKDNSKGNFDGSSLSFRY